MTEGRPKILVVDDQPANIVALKTLLKHADADIVEARSGNAALAQCLDHEFALILLDVQMPDMDGYEVADLLSGAESTRAIPIIFLTATYKDDYHRLRGYDVGAVDFIEKPIDDAVLRSKVGIFLDLYRRKRDLERANESLLREITEREAAQAELARKNEDLARMNKEVQQFAYIVSHDLRAPLTNIAGFVRELEYSMTSLRDMGDGLLTGLTEDQARTVREILEEGIPEAMEFITSSVTRMDGMIAAILKLSRLGRRKLEFVRVDMRHVVTEALKSLAFQLDEKKATTVVGDLPVIDSDPTAMEQVFGNLLSNAVKFLQADRPGRLEISARVDSQGTIFDIADNGRGMADGDIAKAFQLFRRVGPQDVPGEGMGLPYVEALVRRLGGTVTCHSQLGVGTTFTVTLPRELPPQDLPAF